MISITCSAACQHTNQSVCSSDVTPAKEKILGASLSVIRTKGYAATTVDDLCEAAGVTKGAFFHHFKSKEDLGVSAAGHWSAVTNELFANAPYRELADPLDRVFAYLDFRRELLRGRVPEFTCLVGTMVQEVHDTSPAIREACERCISGHCADVAKDIAQAKVLYAPKAPFTAEGLAFHIQAVLQGAFILAKAKQEAEIAADSIAHLRRYLELLFQTSAKQPTKKKSK